MENSFIVYKLKSCKMLQQFIVSVLTYGVHSLRTAESYPQNNFLYNKIIHF